MVTLFDARDTGTDIHDNASTFMSKNGWENTFGIGAGQSELVGVANAGGLDFDQHFTRLGTFEIELYDLKGFACLKRYGCARFHTDLLAELLARKMAQPVAMSNERQRNL
jgi:hypothetical protein